MDQRNAGGGSSYQLTQAGIESLRTPPPPPAGYDENLLQYHKSYLLLLLLRAEERKASLSDLCGRLNTETAKRILGFGQEAPDDKVQVNRPLAAWILDSLAASSQVTRTEFRGSPSYHLTETGEELLGASEQYPTIKFTLTGKELHDLMTTAKLSQKALVGPTVNPQTSQPESTNGTGVPTPVLTAEQVFAEFERLKQERYAQHGMVPIHVLRQIIADRFGPAAATHDVLDPLVKGLRRERRIRLVALGMGGSVTEQQIEDSICGENEIYFTIESAHEYASV